MNHFRSSEANYGPVVQLVRMPACHAGGREFESRPDRNAEEVGEPLPLHNGTMHSLAHSLIDPEATSSDQKFRTRALLLTSATCMDIPSKPLIPMNGKRSIEPIGESEDKLSLLLVEDNPETLILVGRMLRKRYDVTKVSDPIEAEREIQSRSFDGILMDINLGADKSGIDLLGHARETTPNQSTPILALTAYALPGDDERFLSYGFDAYLGKPFTKDQLIERIAEVIG